MIYWWQKKPEFKKLATEVRYLFLKNSIIPPQDIMPKCIIPGDKAEDIFITKLRLLIREKTVKGNLTNMTKREELIKLYESKGINLKFGVQK